MALTSSEEQRWLFERLVAWAQRARLCGPAEAAILIADGDVAASRHHWLRHLRADARLAARLVRLAASAAVSSAPGPRGMGAPRPALRVGPAVPPELAPLDEALGRLGPVLARRVMVEDLVSRLFPMRPGAVTRLMGVRRHSLAVAVGAAAAARDAGCLVPGELFLAGLLHDVGQVALLEHGGGAYRELVDSTPAAELSRVEVETLGFDHGVLGAAMVAALGLPQPLVSTIRDHHRFRERLEGVAVGAHLRRVACLTLGEALAMGLGFSQDGREEGGSALEVAAGLAGSPAAAILGLEPRRLRRLARDADEAMGAITRSLAVGGQARGVDQGLRTLWGDGGPIWQEDGPLGGWPAAVAAHTPSLLQRLV